MNANFLPSGDNRGIVYIPGAAIRGCVFPGCIEPVYAPLLNRPGPCQVDEDSRAAG